MPSRNPAPGDRDGPGVDDPEDIFEPSIERRKAEGVALVVPGSLLKAHEGCGSSRKS